MKILFHDTIDIMVIQLWHARWKIVHITWEPRILNQTKLKNFFSTNNKGLQNINIKIEDLRCNYWKSLNLKIGSTTDHITDMCQRSTRPIGTLNCFVRFKSSHFTVDKVIRVYKIPVVSLPSNRDAVQQVPESNLLRVPTPTDLTDS